MKKLKSLVAVVISLVIVLSSGTAYAKAPDTLQSLTEYKMTLNFDDAKKTLTGIETVKFTNTYEDELKDIVFHLYPDSYGKIETMPAFSVNPDTKELPAEAFGDIDIEKVIVNNSEVKFTEDNQILKLSLQEPLKAGESMEFTISFALKLPMGPNRLGYVENIYSLTNWYPILSIYDPKADKWDENPFHPNGESNYSDVSNYDITINVPTGYVIASTGVIKSDTKNDKVETYNLNAEKVRDFVFTMSKDYKVLSKTVDGVKVNSYYTDPSTEAVAKRMLDICADSMQFYSETFGKYPYPELDVTETYLSGGAMEYPQLIQMGKYFAASGDGNYNDYSFLDMAVAHETGHQWWYVLVGNNEFMEPIMDESITVYSTAYYFEKRYGKYDQQGTLMQFRSMGRMYGDLSSTFDMSVDKYKDFSDYVSTIYSRAPVVFEDLRHQTSEDTFVKILKTYFERYEYKNGSINAFLNIIGEIAGDKVKENIKTSITSPNYSPKDLQLTQEEKIEMNRQMYKKSLQEQENIYGLNLSSILLKGLNGETIYIVKPSNMTESEKLAFDMNINPMIDGMKKAYGIKFVAKSASELTETEKSGNLILFGNASTNKVISEMQDGFPVIISTKGLIMDDLAVITNNASGIFTVKNPKDNTKVVLVYFWYQNMRDYYLFDGGSANQFIININDKKVISGKF